MSKFFRCFVNSAKSTGFAPITRITTDNSNTNTTTKEDTIILNNISLKEYNSMVDTNSKELAKTIIEKAEELAKIEANKLNIEYKN